MEVADIREKYAEQISTIKNASRRSWLWTGVAAVFGTIAVSAIAPAVMPAVTAITLGEAIGTALASVNISLMALGLGAAAAGIVSARHGVSVDVDRDVQIEDINARRSAEYGAKAIVKELEEAGMAIRVEPNDQEKEPAPNHQPGAQVQAAQSESSGVVLLRESLFKS